MWNIIKKLFDVGLWLCLASLLQCVHVFFTTGGGGGTSTESETTVNDTGSRPVPSVRLQSINDTGSRSYCPDTDSV